jgi:hypothetical protein
MRKSMDEDAEDVTAVEIVGPLAAAFAMALNTTFQVLVTRNVISSTEAKALLETMADTLRQGHEGEPSSPGVEFVAQLIKTSASTFHSSPEPLDG